MAKERIENKIEEFLEFSFFHKIDTDALRDYLLLGEESIPNQLPSVKEKNLWSQRGFYVEYYLKYDFFEEDYNEKEIEIYKRWMVLLVKIAGKEVLNNFHILHRLQELNWPIKDYMETFNISFEEFVKKELRIKSKIDDKVILQLIELKGEKELIQSIFKGNLSSIKSFYRMKFAFMILPFIEEENKKEVLQFIKDNINSALIESVSSYEYGLSNFVKTDEEVVLAFKNYFEQKNLKETVDTLKQKLDMKDDKYTIFESDNIKALLSIALKLVKQDGDYKYLVDLFQGVSHNGLLHLVYDIYKVKFKNLEQYKSSKKKLMEVFIDEKYVITYGLCHVENSLDESKDLLIEILDYEGEKIKEVLDYIPHKLRAKICFLIMEENKDEFYINYVRSAFEKTFKEYLDSNCHSKEHFSYYIWFLEVDEINAALKKLDENLDLALAYTLTKTFLDVFDCKNNVQLFVQLLIKLDVDFKKFVKTFAYEAHKKKNSLRPILVEFLKYNGLPSRNKSLETKKAVNILKWEKYEYIVIEHKMNILDVVFNDVELEPSDLRDAVLYLKDKSKKVREACAEGFSKIPDFLFKGSVDKFQELLNSPKDVLRLLAVKVLSNHVEIEEVKAMLEERFKVETELKARNIIMEALNFNPAKLYVDDNREFDLTSYFQSLKVKKSENAVDFSTLPKIRFKGKEEYVSEEILNYFVKAYLNSSELKLIKDAAIVSEGLNSEDLAKLANEIYNNYIGHSIDTKKKGLILLAAVHGDYDTVENLKKLINELASNSRHKLAQYTVKALVLNGSSHALTIVNSIKSKYRFKSVKESAREAFLLAAKEFNMNIADLEDKIIPNLGFEGISCKEYDYGDRIIKVYLNNQLELEVENEKGKIVKNIPKASKNDIEESVEKAKEDFKNLKKELKAVKKLQIERLEEALISLRTWSSEDWKELFMENPIMNRLGKSFLWGIYEGESLKQEFLYDDNLFDLDYEEIELEENMKIGLVHPLELGKEKIVLWEEILGENEIMQPFPQLTRDIYTALEDKEIIEEFDNIKINDLTLTRRLDNMGWYKGSIRDAGSYSQYYREWEDLGIGAEVTFDDDLGFHNIGDKDIAIKKLEFYKAGSVKRGSYIYDEIDKERRIPPKDISKRLYSEVIYSVYKALK